jgi:type IV secretory pathway VirB2 component (pilin)
MDATKQEEDSRTPFLLTLHTWQARQTYVKLVLFLLAGAVAAAHAQAGFATSEITTPIRNLVNIANATIAGLSILAVIFYAIRWIGGDEGAAKRIIGVIVVAIIALGAANFLAWVTGKTEFDTFVN